MVSIHRDKSVSLHTPSVRLFNCAAQSHHQHLSVLWKEFCSVMEDRADLRLKTASLLGLQDHVKPRPVIRLEYFWMFAAGVCVVRSVSTFTVVTPAGFSNYYIMSLAAHCVVIMVFCERLKPSRWVWCHTDCSGMIEAFATENSG